MVRSTATPCVSNHEATGDQDTALRRGVTLM
jgi:hypothetical protein